MPHSMTSQPTFSRVPCYLAEIRLWFLNGLLEWASGHEPFFKSSTFYGILGGKDSIISSNWLALPSPKTNNSLLKNDDLGDYFGKPETRRGRYWKGFASPWSFERTFDGRKTTQRCCKRKICFWSLRIFCGSTPLKTNGCPLKIKEVGSDLFPIEMSSLFRGHSLVFGGVCGYHDHTLVYLSYSSCSRSSPPIWPQTNKIIFCRYMYLCKTLTLDRFSTHKPS